MMKDAVLLELAARWEREAAPPEAMDGSDEAKVGNAKAQATRETLRACADSLRVLVEMLGDASDQTREAGIVNVRVRR